MPSPGTPEEWLDEGKAMFRRERPFRRRRSYRAVKQRIRRIFVNDPFDLSRFVEAQDSAGTYEGALSELRAGSKHGHWMWFIFPQIAGLGQSPTSRKYAISSLDEARAFLNHPVLGARLLDCARAILAVDGRSAEQILGGIDARKLHSSSTLFLRAAPDEAVFQQTLDKYFGGVPDEATDRILSSAP
jgi:uncharacterized protein (DUF1810 family)